MSNNELKVYLRLSGELSKRFLRIKDHLGVKNDTEVFRSLISWYWRQHKEELLPPLEHYNLNPDGVLVLDRTLPRNQIVQVYFRPEGAWCEFCGIKTCKHVNFALTIPKVQEILREKGWGIK